MYACFVYTCVIKKEKEPREEGKEKKKENLETWLLFPYYRFSSIHLRIITL